MKIVHISNKPVYPIVDGGCAAMASLLQCLGKIGEVKHLSLSTYKHPFSRNAYPDLTQFGLQEGAIEIDTKIKPVSALYSLLTGVNYNLKRFESKQFSIRLTDFLHEYQPDVVILESLFLSSCIETIRECSNARIFLRSHNVEHQLWEQQANNATGWRKKYFRSLSKSLKKAEIKRLHLADEIWTITEEDKYMFGKLGIRTSCVTIPFAIDPTTDKAHQPANSFFHLGSMNWQPNIEAVELLLHQIWPNLPQQPELFIAGSFGEKNVAHSSTHIHFLGRVADSDQFMQEHGSLVSPIISGSGVRIKVLEALANGAPVITTKLGASGINPEESGVQVASIEEFPEKIEQLFSDEKFRTNLSEKALAYIGKEHSFAVVIEKIRLRIGQ